MVGGSVRKVTTAAAVLAGRFALRVAIDVEIGEPVKHDLSAFFKTDFDQRIVAIAGNHGVNASSTADPCAMRVGEICTVVAVRAHSDCSADEDF